MTNPPSPSALQGPVQPPASGKPPRQLVVFLHGVGADGNDLIGLAPYFAQALPDAVFISPNAPYRYDMAPFGYQWFSLIDRSPTLILDGIRAAAPILNAFLDEQLARYDLSDDQLGLVGFSQGTMMSLHVGLRRKNPPAAIVGYSGLLAGSHLLAEELVSRPPVLLVHGAADEVVSPQMLPASVEALRSVQVPVQGIMRPGLGHSIDQEGLEAGIRFLAEAFAARGTSG